MAQLIEQEASKREHKPAQTLRSWLWAAVFGVTYLACADFGSLLTVPPHKFISFWLPSGLYVAVLLLIRTRHWPKFIVFAAAANLLFDLMHGQPLFATLGFTTGNTLEALIGAWLVRRYIAEWPDLSSTRQVIGLVLFSAMLSTAVSATIGAAVVAFGLHGGTYSATWITWWAGDAMGILVFAPVILSWRSAFRLPPKPVSASQVFSIVALVAVLILVLWVICGSSAFSYSPRKFLLIPLMLWAALIFGVKGSSLITLLVAIVAASTGAASVGLPDHVSQSEYMLLMNLFLATFSSCGLLPATLLTEQRRKEEDLRLANLELDATNEELSRANKSLSSANKDITQAYATLNATHDDLLATSNLLSASLEKNKWLVDALDSASSYVFIKDSQLKYVYANRLTLELMQCTAEELVGADDSKFFSADSLATIMTNDRRVLELGETSAREEEVTPALVGEKRVYWAIKRPLFDAQGNIWGLCGVSTDITERKRSEEKLRDSEFWLKESQRVSRVGSYIMDIRQGSWISTDTLDEIFGIGPDFSRNVEGWAQLMPESDRQEMVEYLLSEVFGKKQPFSREYRIVRFADKALRWVHGRGELYFDADGNPIKMAGTIQDITERRQAEEKLHELNTELGRTNEELRATNQSLTNAYEQLAAINEEMTATTEELYTTNDELVQSELALRESEARHSKMVANIGDVLVIIDRDGFNRYKSPNLEKWFGWKPQELVGVSTWDNVHPEDLDAAQKFISSIQSQPNATGTTECRYRCKDGSYKWIEFTGTNLLHDPFIDGILGNYHDITERKLMEMERAVLEDYLRQSQKMEAIGTLAGGIAHDFNNLLFAILAYGELVRDTLAPDTLEYENMQALLAAGNRAKDLVQQILTFSRKSQVALVPLDLRQFIKESTKLLRATLPTTLEFHHEIDPVSSYVMADPTEMHQVLMNLCTNAAHAIGDIQGVLQIGLREMEIESQLPAPLADLAPGLYLELSVIDNGCGIPAEVLPKIFDPFFTTKDPGKGTGMGLSVVHGIIARLGGEIVVESTVGKGSRFTVYFPAKKNSELDMHLMHSEIPTGSASVLVVDDEVDVRRVLQQSLASLGYQVACAGSGMEALEMLKAHPGHYDVLVTDQTMPNLTGIELAEQALALQPELPIILCTGYSEAISEDTIGRYGIAELLYKPIERAHLASAVHRATHLNSSSATYS